MHTDVCFYSFRLNEALNCSPENAFQNSFTFHANERRWLVRVTVKKFIGSCSIDRKYQPTFFRHCCWTIIICVETLLPSNTINFYTYSIWKRNCQIDTFVDCYWVISHFLEEINVPPFCLSFILSDDFLSGKTKTGWHWWTCERIKFFLLSKLSFMPL